MRAYGYGIAAWVMCAAWCCGPASAEERTLAAFADPAVARAWRAVNDGVMGGVSDGRLRVTGEGTLEFFGSVSLDNNGGFASVRSAPGEFDLSDYDGLMIRVRGDGKRYECTVQTDAFTMAGSYRAKFETQAGQWQELFLPFRAFEATSFGRVLRNAPPLNAEKVRWFGFLIADKQVGPFRLEVDWIRAVHAPGESADDGAMSGPVDRAAAAREVMLLAIERGVPLFNEGRADACAAVYEVAASSVIRLAGDELPAAAARSLREALSAAAHTDDQVRRAWLLRHGMDDALGVMSGAGQE